MTRGIIIPGEVERRPPAIQRDRPETIGTTQNIKALLDISKGLFFNYILSSARACTKLDEVDMLRNEAEVA